MDDLFVSDEMLIPAGELEWRFSTSGGPGGQHANRSATRVTLRWRPATTAAVGSEVRKRLVGRLHAQLTGDVIEVVVDETRSQWRNRQIARDRLSVIVRDALQPPPPPRKPTKPGAGIRRRRLERKRRRGETKRLRRPPERE